MLKSVEDHPLALGGHEVFTISAPDDEPLRRRVGSVKPKVNQRKSDSQSLCASSGSGTASAKRRSMGYLSADISKGNENKRTYIKTSWFPNKGSSGYFENLVAPKMRAAVGFTNLGIVITDSV